jgi:hypothetical protein
VGKIKSFGSLDTLYRLHLRGSCCGGRVGLRGRSRSGCRVRASLWRLIGCCGRIGVTRSLLVMMFGLRGGVGMLGSLRSRLVTEEVKDSRTPLREDRFFFQDGLPVPIVARKLSGSKLCFLLVNIGAMPSR